MDASVCFEHVMPIEPDKIKNTKIVEKETLLIDLTAIDVVVGPVSSLRREEEVPPMESLMTDLIAIPTFFFILLAVATIQGFLKRIHLTAI